MRASHKGVSRRGRGVLCVVTASLLGITLLAGPLAQADDLDDRKSDTQSRIADNQKTIDQEQGKIDQAEAALTTSRQQLADAQADLTTKQQAVAAAQAEDDRLAAELAAAEQTLADRQADLAGAQAAVSQGEANLAAQHDRIGLVVQTSTQQNTALLSLSILLAGFDVAQVNNRLQWANTVFDASQNVMDDLKTLQAQLVTAQTAAQQAQEAAQAAEAAVQTQRDAAAAQLANTQQAQAVAAQAAAAVSAQVTANQKAEADAQQALADAKAQDAQLQKEMDQIEADIKARIAAQQAAANKNNSSSGSSSSANQPAPSSGTFFYRPVSGRVTSTFGYRFHPILHYTTFHSGVDLAAACGTPVHAAADGVVKSASYNSSLGNYLVIDHGKIAGNYWSTGYGHNTRFAVSVGQHVTRGQVVAYAGTTGMSTGCHVHFSVYKNGTLVNGLPLIS